MTWGSGELGVGGSMLSERCGWIGILFTVILETLGIDSLGEVSRKKILLLPIFFSITKDECARMRSR